MDYLTFIVELVKALAWPVVALVIIVTFKDKLTTLLENMTELKGLGIEAKFARGAKQALAEVEALEAAQAPQEATNVAPPANELPFDPNAPFDDPFLAKVQTIDPLLVVSDPKAALLLARANIEAAVKRVMVREGVLVRGGRVNQRLVLEQMAKDQIIQPTVFNLALELIALGNRGAHGEFEPSVSAAKDFVDASNKLVKMLLRSKRPDSLNP